MLILMNFVVLFVFMSLLAVCLNILTARRLKMSVSISVGRICNKSLEPARNRSAKVVTALSVLLLLTHLPYFSWCFYAYWTSADRTSYTSLIFEYVSKHFLFLNSCINPPALFLTSTTFNRLFRKYFCCSKERIAIISGVS
ncbi:hypothetical protein L9F63_023186 [Diploptera punctata]|uniref:G-protein coupled receptors family 1 profile domain-containing protein n=1 Tax=Diploptera punctata TaxID=6984 RepID=A0AAD7ZJ52_DIPPU|nr:hypothetical protein L9F63_023186 [Diploptera punctata]